MGTRHPHECWCNSASSRCCLIGNTTHPLFLNLALVPLTITPLFTLLLLLLPPPLLHR